MDVINGSPRSPSELFDAILLDLTRSAEARPSWSPYRALLLLLVGMFRDIMVALGQIAAHPREPGPEAAPKPEREAGNAAPLPLRPTQPARPRAAAQQAARPRRARPQAAPATAPEPQKPPLPSWGRAAGTPKPAAPRLLSSFRPASRPPPFSAGAKPAPWHVHNVPRQQ
jgi:hypothetical protein